MLINKLTSPGDRPLIKAVNANREDILSVVDGNRGITLTCESSIGNILPGILFREVRDGWADPRRLCRLLAQQQR